MRQPQKNIYKGDYTDEGKNRIQIKEYTLNESDQSFDYKRETYYDDLVKMKDSFNEERTIERNGKYQF